MTYSSKNLSEDHRKKRPKKEESEDLRTPYFPQMAYASTRREGTTVVAGVM